MTGFGAVLDACVLVPYVLTDSLLSIAGEQLFEPLWSDVILDETFRSLKKIYPHREHYSFEARLSSMDRAFPHARVAGWQSLEQGIARYWPDPKDAHVVATAITGRAETIVTSNLKDFPNDLLRELGLHASSPDAFLLDLLDLNTELVVSALIKQAARTNRPSLTISRVLDSLNPLVPSFSATVRELLRS
jgi:predicted nucleic acid-binding protein